jgi:hypothetical protein
MNRSERTALIKDAVDRAREEAKKTSVLLRHERLWCKDTWRLFEVFQVPVDGLVFNIDNRRFVAERKLMEEKLDHSLDPENSPTDEKSVISLLLDSSCHVDGDLVVGSYSKDYLALKRDWQKRRQESPFWIRPDGIVRNGNRRLAMLKRIREEDGVEGTRSVEAIIINPNEVNEQELFEMEQREQLTENFKLRYTDINLLITLRDAAEGRQIDWNDPDAIERVAGELQEFVGGDKTYTAIQLRAIKFMDDYLTHIQSPGEYQKLIGRIERFRDVGKNMAKMLEDYPDDAVDLLQLQFAGISAGIKHGDIRSLGRLFREDRDAYRVLRDKVVNIEQQDATNSTLESPDVVAATTETNDDPDNDEPALDVSNYPKERVQSVILDAIDGFESQNLDTNRKLSQVVSRLRPITIAHLTDGLQGSEQDEIREYLSEILAWCENAKALLT